MAINPNTETWVTVRKHCEERVETLRQKLETDITHDDSIKVRAQIKACRAVLALGGNEVPLGDEPDMLPE